MGKNAKPKVKKDKVVRVKTKSSPEGTYVVERLVDGKWSEPETVKSPGRKALMKKLGGYDDGVLVNLKPQIKVRVI